MLSDDDVKFHLRQAEIAVEVTENEGETTMPFRPGYVLELLQQIKSGRAEVAALRERLAVVEHHNARLTDQVHLHGDHVKLLADHVIKAEQRLATVTPIVEAVAKAVIMLDEPGELVKLVVLPIAALEQARAWLASQAHESAPAAVDVAPEAADITPSDPEYWRRFDLTPDAPIAVDGGASHARHLVEEAGNLYERGEMAFATYDRMRTALTNEQYAVVEQEWQYFGRYLPSGE